MKIHKINLLNVLIPFMMASLLTCDKTATTSNDTSPPVYPSCIASDATHRERINVTWEKIDNAEYYIIAKSKTGRAANYTEITKKIYDTTYYDEDVEPGKTYYYKVKAVNRYGESVYGQTDMGSTKAEKIEQNEKIVPRPSWVTATNGTEVNKITLKWENTSAGSYNIYRKEKEDGIYSLLVENLVSNLYEDYSIDPDVHYLYKIEAVDGGLTSEFSASTEGFSGEPTILTPSEFYLILKPVIEHVWQSIDKNNFIFPMTIYGAFEGQIDITMTPILVNGEYTGSTVKLDFFNYNQDGHINNGTLTLDLDTTLTGKETGTLYVTGAHKAIIDFDIDIAPRPDGHSSEQGGSYTITTEGSPEDIAWLPPDNPIVLYAPQSVIASKGEYYGYVKIIWELSSKAINYKVYRSEYPYGVYVLLAENVPTTQYNDFSVEPEVDYFYKIKAFYGDIESDYSLWSKGYSGTIPPDILPPENISATDGDYPAQIVITWNAVAGADFYTVYRSLTAEGFYGYEVSTGITGTSFIDLNVTPGQQYFYKVKAYNNASVVSDFSGYASGYAGTVPDMPAAPLNVAATDKTSHDKEKIVVTWDDVIGAQYYRVYRATTANGAYTLISSNETATAYNDIHAVRDTVYYYRVKAVNLAGESDYSDYDEGSREITIDEFYHDVFEPAAKYARDRIYVAFPEPYIFDKATFPGDNGGTLAFKVNYLYWAEEYCVGGKSYLTYTNLNNGDLNINTNNPDENGIVLNGELIGKVCEYGGYGVTDGTLSVSGPYSAEVEYHLIIANKFPNSGNCIVTFNGETKTFPYEP